MYLHFRCDVVSHKGQILVRADKAQTLLSQYLTPCDYKEQPFDHDIFHSLLVPLHHGCAWTLSSARRLARLNANRGRVKEGLESLESSPNISLAVLARQFDAPYHPLYRHARGRETGW